jgi:uncharacterized sulfatase
MPYNPPEQYIKKFLPYLSETPDAQKYLREFNRDAAQWLIPLKKPLSDIESTALSDVYDAEVAYQDHLLYQLISTLESSYHKENSLVIFLSDHGEMLGEHGYMGHGFGVHEELIRVPLFMRVPYHLQGNRVESRVSITQLFYTVLDYYGFESVPMPYANEIDVQNQSLLRMPENEESLSSLMVSEAYSPENAIKIMQRHNPDLIDKYKTKDTHRAIYQNNQKMIAIEGLSKVLYNLASDPLETEPYIDERTISELSLFLEDYLEVAALHQKGTSKQKASLSDELIQKRMRDLGYLE